MALLNTLASQGDVAQTTPVVINADGHLLGIEGYAIWEFAKRKTLRELECLEYDLDEEESADRVLQECRAKRGLNAFNIICIALEREPLLRDRARFNQSRGRDGGLSVLTEAQKVDVRKQVAADAKVSVGNVHKVKQLKAGAHEDVLAALRSGEISINRAHRWLKDQQGFENSKEAQREALLRFRSRLVDKTIARLVRPDRQQPESATVSPELLLKLLAKEQFPINVEILRIPGRILAVTEDLLVELGLQSELPLR